MTVPDLIILNGRAMTFDDRRPRAQAVAVTNGVISAVGSTAEIRELAAATTSIVDAAGGSILPGFIDSHVHLFAGGAETSYLSLRSASGEDELLARVRDWAAQCSEETVVFAVQASYEILGRGRGVTRQELDRVLPDRPFAMIAPDYHTVWANTKALEYAGILYGGQVDPGSEIVLDAQGIATGELRDPGAYAHVLRHTRFGGRELAGLITGRNPEPAPTGQQRMLDREALRTGLLHCARHGITGLHNMDGNFYTLELLEEIDGEGDLLCRTEVPFHLKSSDPLERLEEAHEMQQRWRGDRLWCNRVKMFMDGVIENGTALMLQPYPDSSGTGEAVFSPDHFDAACCAIDAMGLQIATHAIGDLAVRRVLDGYSAAQSANGPRDARHRIEHIEVLSDSDLPRFAELGIAASMQPGYAPFGGMLPPESITRMLHDDQIPGGYRWQDIRDSGAKLAFSTDWPIIPVDPMANLRAAVAPLALPPPWRDQRQSLEAALVSYTLNGAWLEFNEHRKGRIAPGYMADIAVMTHDLEGLDPVEVDKTKARLTVCDGRVTWDAETGTSWKSH